MSRNTTRIFYKVSLICALALGGLCDATPKESGASSRASGLTGATILGQPSEYIMAGAIQTDGAAVSAGYYTTTKNVMAVTRHLANGSIDTSFSSDGFVVTSLGTNGTIAYSTLIQTNARIIVAGAATNANSDFGLVRFLTDGSLDTSFNTSGKVSTTFVSGDDAARAVVLYAGTPLILAAGNSSSLGFSISRYWSNGQLDTSFSSDGKQTTIITSGSDIAYAAVIQTDSRVVLGGVAVNDFALSRYLIDGSLDTSFSSDGKQTTNIGSSDIVYAIGVDTSGRAVAVGYSDGYIAIARYTTNGNLDTSFSSDGKALEFANPSSMSDAGYSLAIQTNGQLVVTGSSLDGSFTYTNIATLRFTTNGVLDTSFSNDGIVLRTFTDNARGSYARLNSAAAITIGGYGQADFQLLRYSSNGNLDTSFSTDGRQNAAFPADVTASHIERIAFQPDYKTIAQGRRVDSGEYYSTLVRYLSNGVLDTTFGSQGILYSSLFLNITQASIGERGADVSVDTSGRVLAVGGEKITPTGSTYRWAVIRYLSNGSLDTSFNTSGKFTFISGTNESAKDVAIQTDGKLIVAGKATSGAKWGVLRLETSGNLDTSFNTVGWIRNSGGNAVTDTPRSVVIRADGRIVVGGVYSLSVARYTTNGRLDTSFHLDGVNHNGTNVEAYAVAVQPDNKTLIAGSGSVVRYRDDGYLDTTFSGDGVANPGYTVGKKDMALQPNGKILVVGTSSSYLALVRLLSNGELDPDFGSSGVQTFTSQIGTTYAGGVALTSEGRIMVGGDNFTLARCTTCGPLDATFGPSREGIELSDKEALFEHIRNCPKDREYLEELYWEKLASDKQDIQ
jgi:uncharacterized delta-60 repeat protein